MTRARSSRSSAGNGRDELPKFWQRSSVRRMISGAGALIAVVSWGVLGYVFMGWKAFDALFMVVITVSGVGFGEVRPLASAPERIHTMLIIGLGIVSVAYFIAGFIQFLTEGEIRQLLGQNRVRRQIETLKDHAIVVGYGRMGELICSELTAAEMPFLVIERNSAHIPDIERNRLPYIAGDATEEDTLRDAGVERAKTLVIAVSSDSDSVFITLTARQMAPKLEIVARAELPTTQKKLRQAGANHVVVPAAIGAHRIASLLTNPSAVEFVELVTHRSHLAIEMDEVPVHKGGSLAGLTLRDADIGRRTGVIVVAVKRGDGSVEFPPTGDLPFEAGDAIVLLGRRNNLDQFRREFRCDVDSRSGSG
jgi:voltage-gated potassium channel